MSFIGGAEGDRTPDLRIANRTTGKTLSICLFDSCSHQEISRVFPFFPIPYHRVSVASFFFGHVLAIRKLTSKASRPSDRPTKIFWSTAAVALLYQLPKKSFKAADVSAGFSSISQCPEGNFMALTWSDISAA